MSLSNHKKKIHLVGIGGIGMSGIAELLLRLGHSVTGSDLNTSGYISERLRSLGAEIQKGHSDEILKNQRPDVIVFSSAITFDNPELRYAREHQIPAIPRAEMLGELMRLKRSVAVAGSHGKTTTTGMLSLLAREGGLDPTIVIGGKFDAIGSNASWGQGQWMIAEADESDGSFLNLSPELAIVTNVDREHLDHYKDYNHAKEAFVKFINRIPFYGRSILCSDNDDLYQMRADIHKPHFWYGMDESRNPTYLVKIVETGKTSTKFQIYKNSSDHERKLMLETLLYVPGTHNVLNATAAIALADVLGIPPNVISKAISSFEGVKRRFEYKGQFKGSPVIEDYAHHPTEIRATLEAARSRYGVKPLVVFQPHRYSRTRDQWTEFSKCFSEAEKVLTVPIYAASELAEEWTKKIDREFFAANIDGGIGKYFASIEDLKLALADEMQSLGSNRPLLILGAGNIYSGLSSLVEPV